MQIYGWGRYPRLEAAVMLPQTKNACVNFLEQMRHVTEHSRPHSFIVRGLGRSYGDSSLASRVLDTQFLNCFQSFDENTGLLKCESGVSLGQIIEVFVPQGWFLPVTPGTRFVTIGGAIASDVHGKNHHISGTFCDHVAEIEILLGNGEKKIISPTEYPDLFHATCGGMGLTGIILSASIYLKPISSSNIIQSTIKARDLNGTLQAFEDNQGATYSVAWIDCLAKGKNLGRSLLMLGEHAQHGPLAVNKNKAILMPIDAPSCLLNRYTIRSFNAVYYNKASHKKSILEIPLESFFYPLDTIANWNRLYGKDGFIQYQLVLPKDAGESGLREILQTINESGKGSFLAVLKIFGKANQNLLSFPMEGYNLAIDFKVEPSLFNLLDDLDQIVLKYGGRLYLSKDARMSECMFKKSYPLWFEFEVTRERYHAVGSFASNQSIRFGLR